MSCISSTCPFHCTFLHRSHSSIVSLPSSAPLLLDEERFRSLTFPVPVGVTTAHSSGGDRVARSLHRHPSLPFTFRSTLTWRGTILIAHLHSFGGGYNRSLSGWGSSRSLARCITCPLCHPYSATPLSARNDSNRPPSQF